jgi:hypothetical protein
MKCHFQFNVLPKLQEGETVLLFLPTVWVMSSRSMPSYRVFASVPPLFEAGVYITERRILILVSLLRLVTQEVSLWFGDFAVPGEDEIRSSSVGKGSYLGPYLDVTTTNNDSHWLRSSDLRVRMYTRHAHQAHAIISQLLASREYACCTEALS